MPQPVGLTVADEPPQPPQAPPGARRLVVPRGHAIGQAAVVLIVVLALVGAVGEAQGRAHSEADAISVPVEYPSRIRDTSVAALELTIEPADRPIEDVSVAIDSTYLDAFSEVRFLPEATAATRQRTVIPVGDIGAHGDRIVDGELRAERYWLHEGWIEVSTGEHPVARLQLRTLVLPWMETVVRVAIVYVAIFVGLRVMGKREFSQLSPMELITLLRIPEIVSQGILREEFSRGGACECGLVGAGRMIRCSARARPIPIARTPCCQSATRSTHP